MTFHLKPKFGQLGPQTSISSDLLENLLKFKFVNLKILNKNLTSIFYDFSRLGKLNSIFSQISPVILLYYAPLL